MDFQSYKYKNSLYVKKDWSLYKKTLSPYLSPEHFTMKGKVHPLLTQVDDQSRDRIFK